MRKLATIDEETQTRAPTRPGTLIAALAVLVGLAVLFVLARPAEAPDALSPLAAIVLGLVEGLSEYLPISSTGHLLVANRLLGLGGTPESDLALDTYAICIQIGAILAVLVLYRERVALMFNGLLGRSEEGRRLLLAAIAALVPTLGIAFLVKDYVRNNLFSPTSIAVAWFVGGIVILVMGRHGRLRRGTTELVDISLAQAITIGVAQSLAMWPGTSRSLVTILVAAMVGLTLSAAVEFSFLLGLATLGAATVYEGADNGANLIDTFGYVTPAIGLVVAFVSAGAAIRWMVTWLENQGFSVFGWYRLVIGAGAAVAIWAGYL